MAVATATLLVYSAETVLSDAQLSEGMGGGRPPSKEDLAAFVANCSANVGHVVLHDGVQYFDALVWMVEPDGQDPLAAKFLGAVCSSDAIWNFGELIRFEGRHIYRMERRR